MLPRFAALALLMGVLCLAACAPSEDAPDIVDQDNDGILDVDDLCPLHVDGPSPSDLDADGRWASCDDDDDGDARLDELDPSPLDPLLVAAMVNGAGGGALVVSGVVVDDPFEGMSASVPAGAFAGSRSLSLTGLDSRGIENVRSPGVVLSGGFENTSLIIPARVDPGEPVVLKNLEVTAGPSDTVPDDVDPMTGAVLVSGLGDGTYVVVLQVP